MAMRIIVRSLVLAVLALNAGCDLFVSNATRIDRAEQYLASGNQRGAIIELKNVVDDEPDHARARALLAEAMYQIGDMEAAQRELQRALDAGVERHSIAALTANILIASRQFEELQRRLESGEINLNEPERRLFLAQASLGQGDHAAAEQIYRDVLQRDPASKDSHRGLVQTLASKGETDAALDQLELLLAEHPQDARGLLLQGTLLFRSGRIDLAEESYSAALRHGEAELTVPQKVIATTALVEIHLGRGDIPGAEAALKKVDVLVPDSVVSQVLSARISLSKQDYAAASRGLQRVVTQAPNFIPARALLGSALLAQGSFEQAERHLAEVVRRSPENLEARKLLAQVHLRMNQPAEAMSVLVPALEGDTGDAELSALASSVQLRIGDESGAVALLERSVEQQPDSADLKLQLATAYIRTRASDKAVAVLNQITRSEDNVLKEALLVGALAESKGIAAAQKEIERLLSAYPQDVAILNLASSFYVRHGDFERARAALARALAVDSSRPLTLINSARLEMAAGKSDAAQGRFKKVLEIEPDNSAAHLGLAEIALQQGENQEALEWLEALRDRNPKAIEPRLALARLHLSQKDPAAAEQTIAEALSVSPNPGAVHNAAGLLYRQFGRLDASLSAFRAAVASDPTSTTYLINQARAEGALGQLEPARATAARALAQQPRNVSAVAVAAFLDIESKKPDAALARVEELKKLRGSDAPVFVLEGEVLLALRRYAEAAAALERAAAVNETATIAVKLHHARRLAGAPNALEPLESWVGKNPGDLAVRRLLASAYQSSGRNTKALAEYELLVAQAPADALSWNNLAWLRQQAGDSRAEQAGATAYRLAADNPAVADTYGWILLEQGQVARALPILERAATASNHPDIRYHYAAALAKSGSTQQAQQLLIKITSTEQSFESKAEAQRLLRELASGS